MPHSDVDIALVLEGHGVEGSHRVRDAVQTLGDSLSLHFSAVVFSPEELAAMQPDDAWWAGVVRVAKARLEAAKQAMLLAEPGQNCNPIMSHIVLAAIAYGDSLTQCAASPVLQGGEG